MNTTTQTSEKKKPDLDRLDSQMKKLKKKLSEDFVNSLNSAQTEELDATLANLSKKIENVDEEEATHKELNSLKEDVKELTGGFKAVRDDHKNKLKYILLVLKARGNL